MPQNWCKTSAKCFDKESGYHPLLGIQAQKYGRDKCSRETGHSLAFLGFDVGIAYGLTTH